MAKYKVVITDREYESIENEREVLSQLDVDLQDYQYKDKENILRVAKDADALIIQYAKMPRDLIEELDNCKIIARYATGFDGIWMPAQKKEFMYATCQITAGMKCLLMHFRCCWKWRQE